MNKFNVEANDVYHYFKLFQKNGCIVQYYEDDHFNGRTVTINDKELLYFGNCSYLGLEIHPQLVEGSIDATRKYGVQNSTSRALVSTPLYKEMETELPKMFPGSVIVYNSTTLVHYAAMPLLAGEHDAIILDAFAHNSMRIASDVCKANGAYVLVSRHNDIEHVRYLVKRLKKDGYKKIWYCADGIYSMHGDFCDVAGILNLLDEEEGFYAYIDDAHGLGWCGAHGEGYVLGNFRFHDRMIVVGSMAKGMGSTGGVLVVQDGALADILKLSGHTFIFSTPMTPACVGSIIASVKLHQSELLPVYQAELNSLISYFLKRSKELSISIVTKDPSPIQLIRIGDMDKLLAVQKKLIEKGFLCLTVAFPAINKGDEGVRISLTRHLTHADIDSILTTVKTILIEELVN